jgi:hypothetical protein
MIWLFPLADIGHNAALIRRNWLKTSALFVERARVDDSLNSGLRAGQGLIGLGFDHQSCLEMDRSYTGQARERWIARLIYRGS